MARSTTLDNTSLEKSKALLAEAGYADGFDLEILGSSAIGPGHGALLQVIQSDLTKLGIRARINEMDPAQVSDRLEKADYMTTVHTFGRGNRDPGSVFAGTKSLYSAKEGGWTNIENDEYDRLRQELQSTLDRETRKAICRKIQEIMLDECFNNPVAYQPRARVLAPYVKNLTYNMDNTPYVSDMWLDK